MVKLNILDKLKAWKAEGITEKIARQYIQDGFDTPEDFVWQACGLFSGKELKDWKTLTEFDANSAGCWKRAGFKPKEANTYFKVFSLKQAIEWRKCGYSAKEAYELLFMD